MGALLLCGGAWCLWIFTENPTGELPWLPGTWKGAPLILGACFGGVYGALLLILRRFSLRGMLLCSVLSAALAGGLTAYVQTITETQTIRIVREVPSRLQDKYLDVVSREITSQRVLRFLEALHAAGKLPRSRDFNSLTVSVMPSQMAGEIECKLKFDVMAYVDPSSSEIRTAAESYVVFLLDVYKKKALDESEFQELKTMQAQDPLQDWREFKSIEYWIVANDDWRGFQNSLMRRRGSEVRNGYPFLIPESDDKTFDPLFGEEGDLDKVEKENRRLQWLIEQEVDPWLRDRLRECQQINVNIRTLADFEAEFKRVRSQVSQPFAPVVGEEDKTEDEKDK